MIVNFRIDEKLRRSPYQPKLFAYLNIDNKGIAHLERQAQEDEPCIELVYENGEWTLPANAWFLKEGDAQRWQRARYGIFTVSPQGKSSLTGMADADLQIIEYDKNQE